MCSQGSGEQSKYCWSKDNRTRAASLWGENQAGGSESWNFKISHPEGVKLLIQGPADSSYDYTHCGTDQPGKESGSTLGSVQIPCFPHCLCPTGLHSARPGGWEHPWQHPQRDPGGLIPVPCTLSPRKVS